MTCRLRLRLAVIVLGVSACRYTWFQVRPPEEAIARAATGTIQVTKTDSSVVLIKSPTIVQDSLIGISVDREQSRVAIPMREVSSVATQEVSMWRSGGPPYLTSLAGLFLALLFFTIQK